MKFSGDMDMDISYPRKYIAITGVSKYSFYGNIYQYSVTFLTYVMVVSIGAALRWGSDW